MEEDRHQWLPIGSHHTKVEKVDVYALIYLNTKLYQYVGFL